MNDTIFVKDLKISDKVEILDDPEQALVTVLTMTEDIVEETPAETTEGTAEGTTESGNKESENKEEKKE
jgi:hypothetical protein